MRKRKICEAVLSALLAFLLACPTPVLAQVALGVSGTQAQESASQPEDVLLVLRKPILLKKRHQKRHR